MFSYSRCGCSTPAFVAFPWCRYTKYRRGGCQRSCALASRGMLFGASRSSAVSSRCLALLLSTRLNELDAKLPLDARMTTMAANAPSVTGQSFPKNWDQSTVATLQRPQTQERRRVGRRKRPSVSPPCCVPHRCQLLTSSNCDNEPNRWFLRERALRNGTYATILSSP